MAPWHFYSIQQSPIYNLEKPNTMKNLIIALLLISPIILHAQYSKPARVFGKGQLDIQAGVGIFPTYIADHPESIVPPLHLSLRWMVAKPISLNLFTGYSTCRSRQELVFDNARGRWYNETWFLGLENGFHYNKIDNWDLYGGLSLLYQHVRLETDSPELKRAMAQTGIRPQRGKMALTAYIGSRFALSARSSIFAELGYGVSLLKVGVGCRLAEGR